MRYVYKVRESEIVECVQVCNAANQDNEEGGHLSRVCGEEELSIEAGEILCSKKVN